MLTLPFGIIEVAKQANADIIPIAIEQYEKDFYIAVSANFSIQQYLNAKDDFEMKSVAILDLRDQMATLKWDIWDALPQVKRKEIENNYFQEFVDKRLSQWHGFTYEEVRSREFRFKGVTENTEAFAHLQNISANHNTAFLFNKRVVR